MLRVINKKREDDLMNCSICKGQLEKKETAFMVESDGCIVIVKNVPSCVCSQCGETSYNNEATKRLEEIVNQAKLLKTEVAIVNFKSVKVA